MINVSPLAPDKEEYCGNINCDRLHVPYLRGITVNEYKKKELSFNSQIVRNIYQNL